MRNVLTGGAYKGINKWAKSKLKISLKEIDPVWRVSSDVKDIIYLLHKELSHIANYQKGCSQIFHNWFLENHADEFLFQTECTAGSWQDIIAMVMFVKFYQTLFSNKIKWNNEMNISFSAYIVLYRTNYCTAIDETTGCGVVEWFTYHFTTIKICVDMNQLNQYWLQAHFSHCLYERIVTTHSISKWAYLNVRIYYCYEHMHGFIFSCYIHTLLTMAYDR